MTPVYCRPTLIARCLLTLGFMLTIPATALGFEWEPPNTSGVFATVDPEVSSPQLAALYSAPAPPPDTQWEPQLVLESPEAPLMDTDLPPPAGRTFFRSWATLTAAEFALLAVTASMPKDWTGWSDRFIQDGLGNLADAYTNPPVWDDDHWFHNYIGHPYGGSLYYNTVRSQGLGPGQSFLFSALLSTQWEYLFEAVAEQPSIQDLLITPVTGSLLGEAIHVMTLSMKKDGTTFLEKAAILVLNPMSVLFGGGFS